MRDDELRILRERVAAAQDALDALAAPDVAGSVSFAAVTVNNGSYPTVGAAGRVFAVQALSVTGVTSENSTASTSTRAGVFFAANTLSGLPAAGTEVTVSHDGTAFLFSYPPTTA